MGKLLITGGAGFVGHHVIDYFLKNTEYDIISLDRLDFSGNLNRIHQILKSHSAENKKRVKIVYHDLRAEFNQQLIDDLGNIEVILHLAASSHVTRSIKYPLEFVTSNILGTANLLEYARVLPNLKRMIYFSTDEVFGPAVDNVAFTEYDRYNSSNPYSASKAAAEELCVAYKNTYKLPIYITHTMNIYGERQNPEKYIPMCMEKIKRGEKLTIHYNQKTNEIGTRCYLHAQDVADALLFLLNLKEITPHKNSRGGHCPKFNVSSNNKIDNLEIAKIISEEMNVELKYELTDPNAERPGHDFSYSISGDYMRSLGWEPKFSTKDRIRQLAQWYMNGED